MDKKKLNSILEDLANAVGPYSEVIVIGGGYAPLIYRDFLIADKNLPQAAATFDLDLLIPRKTKIKTSQGLNLGALLIQAGFECQQRSLDAPPVESYSKDYSGVDVEVEFLADNRSRGGDSVVQIDGVSAQALSYLEMSIREHIQFSTLSGMKLQVVLPAAWIFHKLLCFDRRRDRSKKLKDLYGAWYVGTVLDEISQQAAEDFVGLRQLHKKWYQNAKNSVERFIDGATPETWSLLEAQDPEGILTQQRFRQFAEVFLGVNALL